LNNRNNKNNYSNPKLHECNLDPLGNITYNSDSNKFNTSNKHKPSFNYSTMDSLNNQNIGLNSKLLTRISIEDAPYPKIKAQPDGLTAELESIVDLKSSKINSQADETTLMDMSNLNITDLRHSGSIMSLRSEARGALYGKSKFKKSSSDAASIQTSPLKSSLKNHQNLSKFRHSKESNKKKV
jgi:hypothetical protein